MIFLIPIIIVAVIATISSAISLASMFYWQSVALEREVEIKILLKTKPVWYKSNDLELRSRCNLIWSKYKVEDLTNV